MIADIIVILIMVICIFLGYKKGLIRVALKVLSFVIALIVAFILYTPISNYIISNTELVVNIENTIKTRLYNQEENNNEENTISIAESITSYADDMKENSVEYISQQVAINIVRVGTWIGLFLIIKIAMIFPKIFGDIIGKLPIIKQFNKMGGTIYGVLEGFILIYGFIAIFSVALPMIGPNPINAEIEKSNICKTMYYNNIILDIII